MQDDKKIQDKLKELNGNKPKTQWEWEDINDYFSMPSLQHDDTKKSFRVDLGRGLSVKVFVNKKTHEFKLFPLSDFLKD